MLFHCTSREMNFSAMLSFPVTCVLKPSLSFQVFMYFTHYAAQPNASNPYTNTESGLDPPEYGAPPEYDDALELPATITQSNFDVVPSCTIL